MDVLKAAGCLILFLLMVALGLTLVYDTMCGGCFIGW